MCRQPVLPSCITRSRSILENVTRVFKFTHQFCEFSETIINYHCVGRAHKLFLILPLIKLFFVSMSLNLAAQFFQGFSDGRQVVSVLRLIHTFFLQSCHVNPLLSPLSLLSPRPPLPPYYSSLINDRLY